jgi:hypothetical protein
VLLKNDFVRCRGQFSLAPLLSAGFEPIFEQENRAEQVYRAGIFVAS